MTGALAVARLRSSRPHALLRGQRLEAFGLVSLGSLFLASERYPVLLTVGSAEIRLQDVLFGILIAASAGRLARWAVGRPALAAALTGFLVCLAVSAVRSPVGTAAIVAVAKYVEFVLAGLAVGLALRSWRRPQVITALIAAATAFTALAASADLVLDDGVRALASDRSGGVLSVESAMTAGAATVVWCALRLTRLDGPAERAFAVTGIVSAVALLLLTKSVVAVGVVIAIAVLTSVLRSRWLWRTAAACVLVLVIAAIGRAPDIKSAAGLGPGNAGSRVAVTAPASGTTPSLWMPFKRREPERVVGGSFVHRIALAYLGVRIASKAPAFGHGWLSTSEGAFLRGGPYDLYMLERFPRLEPALLVSNYPTTSHNAFIQTYSEAGPPAGVLLVGVLLAAMVPAIALLRRQRAVMPWQVACGLAWLIVVTVFLASSALFGGQLETCLLGASIALCGEPGLERARGREWLLAVAATVAIVAAFLAAVMLPRGSGSTPPVARVALLNAAGHELFRSGTHIGAPSSVQLINGVARAWVDGDRVMLRTTGIRGGPDPAERPVAEVPGLSATSTAVVGYRSADTVTINFLDAARRPISGMTMARGVPGLYLSLSPGAAMTVPGARGVALGWDLAYAQSHVTRARPRRISPLTPVVVTATKDVRVFVPIHPVRLSASAGSLELRGIPRTTTTFVGLHPLRRGSGALAPGAYGVSERTRGDRMRIERANGGLSPAWAERATMLFPYVLDDAQHSGVAELASLGVNYRVAALP